MSDIQILRLLPARRWFIQRAALSTVPGVSRAWLLPNGKKSDKAWGKGEGAQEVWGDGENVLSLKLDGASFQDDERMSQASSSRPTAAADGGSEDGGRSSISGHRSELLLLL